MKRTGHLIWIFVLSTGLLLLAGHASPIPVLLADRYLPGSGLLQILGIYACFIGHVLLRAAHTGRISPWQLRIDAGCTRCGQCSRTSRYSALEKQDLEKGRPGLLLLL